MDTDITGGSGLGIFAAVAGKITLCRSPIDLDVDGAVSTAMALGHKLRMQILCTLAPFGDRGLSAGSLSMELKIVPSSASFHLQQMTRASVLIARHEGRSVFYSVNPDVVAALCGFLLGVTHQDILGE